MNIKALKYLAASTLIVLAASCNTPKNVAYVQDAQQGTYLTNNTPSAETAIKARPDDKLQIRVNSKDQTLANLFNLNVTQTSGNNIQMYYTVDSNGNINFPVLGEVHVAGLTRQGVASEIKNLLISRDLIKDPTVTVEFAKQRVNVLGAVSNPGLVELEKDHVTLVDVLAQAGDLQIGGERNNVKVIRTNADGTRQVYVVDMTSAESLFNSPAYYVQQDDLVYVEPSDVMKRTRSANGNVFQTVSFWMSVTTFLMSLGVIIFK